MGAVLVLFRFWGCTLGTDVFRFCAGAVLRHVHVDVFTRTLLLLSVSR